MADEEWSEMSWFVVVEQHELEKYVDSEDNLLGIKA